MRILVVLLILTAGPAQAERVQYYFTGDITSMTGAFALVAGHGTPTTVTGSFIYDTDWPEALGSTHYSPSGSNYGITVVWSVLTMDSASDATPADHLINVRDDAVTASVYDQFTYNTGNTTGYSHGLYFTTTDTSFLTDNSIPGVLDLNAFDSEKLGRVFWWSGSGDVIGEMEYEIMSLTLTPVPPEVPTSSAVVHLDGDSATGISGLEANGATYDVTFSYGILADVDNGSNFPFFGDGRKGGAYDVIAEAQIALNLSGATSVSTGSENFSYFFLPTGTAGYPLRDHINTWLLDHANPYGDWQWTQSAYAREGDPTVWMTLAEVPKPTVKRLSGLVDISGDGIPDLAHINESSTSTVEIFSGSDGSTVRQIEFFGSDWTAVAISTLEDGNADGVSNDPAIAMLARNSVTGLHRARVRDGYTGQRVGSDATFFNDSYTGIDLAVLNDHNGDGVSIDPSILVLAKQDTGRVAVLVKRFSDGAVLGNWTFTMPDFDALAVEGLSPAGGVPAISVLYLNSNTGKSRIRTRRADNGQMMQGMFVAGPSREPRDFAVFTDLNGDGTNDDQAYAILLKREGAGSNVVRYRNVQTGAIVKETLLVSGSWESNSLAVLPDTDSNGFDELVGDSEEIAGEDKLIKARDFDTTDLLQNIFH